MKNVTHLSAVAQLLTVAIAIMHPSWAGTIKGTVTAEGKAGAETGGDAGKYNSRKWKFVERIDYGSLRDFVVYIDTPMGDQPFLAPLKPVRVVTQKDGMFQPHVLPVLKNTVIEWPNQDEIYHNVFSISEANQFDLGLYKEGEVKQVPFNKSGRVDVFCSIHAQMHCIVLVLENPYFATANAKGYYVITNVPAGTYPLRAWHERMPSQVKQVTVPDEGTVEMDFTLGIKDLPKY